MSLAPWRGGARSGAHEDAATDAPGKRGPLPPPRARARTRARARARPARRESSAESPPAAAAGVAGHAASVGARLVRLAARAARAAVRRVRARIDLAAVAHVLIAIEVPRRADSEARAARGARRLHVRRGRRAGVARDRRAAEARIRDLDAVPPAELLFLRAARRWGRGRRGDVRPRGRDVAPRGLCRGVAARAVARARRIEICCAEERGRGRGVARGKVAGARGSDPRAPRCVAVQVLRRLVAAAARSQKEKHERKEEEDHDTGTSDPRAGPPRTTGKWSRCLGGDPAVSTSTMA